MQRLFDAFRGAGKDLYLVGGAVRDLAMGSVVADLDDLDFTTNCRPNETLQILRDAGIRTYKLGIEFGTVGAVLTGPKGDGFPKDVQITTYRSAEYYRRGSRHPVVSFGDTVDQDLARRDFSINSIAMDATGAFFDPYDGLADIKAGTLRVVGDPGETLAEDPLRILRIGRFMSRFGFAPTAELRQAAYDRAAALLEISQQRWLQEMNKVLLGRHAVAALSFLHEVRALGVLLPEVASVINLHRRWPGAPHTDYWQQTRKLVADAPTLVTSWAALLLHTGRPWTRMAAGTDLSATTLFGLDPTLDPMDPRPEATFAYCHRASALLARGIAHRFHFDSATARAVEDVLREHPRVFEYRQSDSDSDVRRLARDLGSHLGPILTFAELRAPDAGHDADLVVDLSRRVRELDEAGRLEPSLPGGLGKVLIKRLGLAAGPAIGDLMSWLQEEIIDGKLLSDLDPDAYVNYLEKVDPPLLAEARAHQGPSRGRKPSLS